MSDAPTTKPVEKPTPDKPGSEKPRTSKLSSDKAEAQSLEEEVLPPTPTQEEADAIRMAALGIPPDEAQPVRKASTAQTDQAGGYKTRTAT